jgi:MFS family permease
MDKAFIKKPRKEVLAASAVFAVWGIMLSVPNEMIKSLPDTVSGPVSGIFSNVIGYVGMKAFGASMDHYLVGAMFLIVAAAPFIYEKKGSALSFLISGSTAVYGFLALAHLIIQPIPLLSSQVLGIGLQTVVFGLVATELFRRVLRKKSFGLTNDRGLYVSAFIMALTGVTALTFLSFVIDAPDMSLIYPVSGTVLGLALVFSSLELLDTSVTGIWSSMILLSLLVLISLLLFEFIIPAIIFLSAEIIIWERKEMFEDIEAPVRWAQNNLDPWG